MKLKKILSVVISAVMLFSLINVPVSAEEELKENSWRYKDGVPIEVMPDNEENDEVAALMASPTMKGIDVSHHQGVIDWDSVYGNVDYAIIRCGYGSDNTAQDDSQWYNNANACTRLGIPFGVYIYSYANTVEKAASEAQHVLRLVNGYNLSFPIYFDMEDNVQAVLSSSERGAIASTFCNAIQSAGYEVGIYANKNWWENYLTDSAFSNSSWYKWVAQYNTSCTYSGSYTMWQYTSSGSVSGISGNVDMNYWYGDWRSVGGLTSVSKSQVDLILEYANSQVGLNNYPGMCQAFVRKCYEYAGIYASSGAASAKEAREKWMISTSRDNIPIGACMYFITDGVYDHVGIYAGNNTIIDSRNATEGVVKETIPQWLWNQYAGWGWQGGIEPSGSVEPPTAVLTASKTKINPNDSITFNFGGENVSNVFTLGIYKDGERVDTIDVTGNTYTYFFSENGSYSAYMTSYNNYGFADSNWVYWDVGQVTAELSIDKAEYKVGDNVVFSFSGNNCGTVFTLGIYKFDQKIETVEVKGNTYNYKATGVGSYSAYMTSYNDSGLADSNWVEFEVLTEYIPVKAEKYNNHTYYVYNEKLSWEKAKEICEIMGGHLVTINDYNEDSFVKEIIKDAGLKRYWLGGVRTGSDWEWITDEKFNYTNWYPGEPNDTASAEKYLEYYDASGWNDNVLYKHNDTGGFVCEIENDISLPVETDIQTSVSTSNSTLNNNASADLTNNAEYDINGTAIFIYKYADNKIAGIDTQNISISAGETITINNTASISISDIGDGFIDKVEAYIWDSINGMKPLAEKAIGDF